MHESIGAPRAAFEVAAAPLLLSGPPTTLDQIPRVRLVSREVRSPVPAGGDWKWSASVYVECAGVALASVRSEGWVVSHCERASSVGPIRTFCNIEHFACH